MADREGMRRALARGWRDDWPILAGVAIAWAVIIALLASKGVNGLRPASYLNNLTLYAATAVFFLVPLGGAALLREKPDRPIRFLRRAFVSNDIAGRFLRGVPMLLALVVFMPAFSALKSAIPLFNDYTWDAPLIAVDRALHGTDPWRLLQTVLDHPWITAAIALIYQLWILLIYAGGVYFCFLVTDPVLRARYFIAYFGIWIVIGCLMAVGLSSVGPCFVGPILGNPYFDEQMLYLYWADSHTPVMVLDVQKTLLNWYYSGSQGLGRGITAMPSMHVAMAFLFALAIRHRSKPLGYAFFAFLVLIIIGSVHLAYHYAVDGYVSILMTAAIWYLARFPARAMNSRIAVPSGAGSLAASIA